MKTRQEIKEIARDTFYSNYWVCVGAGAVVMALIAVASGCTYGAATLILTPPLVIGLNLFSLAVYNRRPASVEMVFQQGFDNFGRKLGGYLWMQLFTMLWALLFVVPGIVKAYSYAMTPYILGDCKNVKAQDALKLSMRMMAGHKAELFVLHLSFLGWALLSALTCGLLHIFYTGPYINNTLAGYYTELKALSLAKGVVTEAELAGTASPNPVG